MPSSPWRWLCSRFRDKQAPRIARFFLPDIELLEKRELLNATLLRATDDTLLTVHDRTLEFSAQTLLSNDPNPGLSGLSILVETGPQEGTLAPPTLWPWKPTYTYTPAAGFVGDDTFTYRVTDGTNVSDLATVTITVSNSAPKAFSDTYITHAGQVLTAGNGSWWGWGNPTPGVLANDTDADGDFLLVTQVQPPTFGLLEMEPNGAFVYEPGVGFVGSDQFSYTISDGIATHTAWVYVEVTNTPPAGAADSFTLLSNQPLYVGQSFEGPEYWTSNTPSVLANDVDLDSDAKSAILEDGPEHGQLLLRASGAFRYIPNPGYTGTDSFTYRVSDGYSSSEPIEVRLTVLNSPPQGQADSFTVHAGQTLYAGSSWEYPNYWTSNIPGVLGNDSDPDSYSPLSATLAVGPDHGELVLLSTGAFRYTPVPGYFGTDSFTYALSDGSGQPVFVPVTLRVTNADPFALSDAYAVHAGQTFSAGYGYAPGGWWWYSNVAGVLANDGDPDGDFLDATLLTQPQYGALTFLASGAFQYTPQSGFVGVDSFSYIAGDSLAATAPVTVTLTVSNNAPVAFADAYTTTQGQAVEAGVNYDSWPHFWIGNQARLLDNDTDVDGDGLVAELVEGPGNGTLAFRSDGSFRYVPNAAFLGIDSFTYRVSDGTTWSAPTSVVIRVGNSVPNANPDAYTVTAGRPFSTSQPGYSGPLGVLANDHDAEGSYLAAVLVTGPQHGAFSLAGDGTFQYTPDAGFSGADSFTYQTTDGYLTSAATTVQLRVVNAAPQGAADAYNIHAGRALVTGVSADLPEGVLANDSDADGHPLAAILAEQASHGTVTLQADGTFTYTPDAGFVGRDSFVYVAQDGTGTLNQASLPTVVTIDVTNAAPAAVGHLYGVEPDLVFAAGQGTRFAGLLTGASDPDGDSITAVLSDGPEHGSLTLFPDGSFQYTPTTGYTGTDSFTYRVHDGATHSSPTTVLLRVEPQPIVVRPDRYAVATGATLEVAAPLGVVLNDLFAEVSGSPPVAVLLQGVDHGSLTFNADGSFFYTPETGFAGPDRFLYRLVRNGLESDPTTVLLSVGNTAPQALADAYQVMAGGTLEVGDWEGWPASWESPLVGVLGNDTDADGDALTAALVETVEHGQLLFNPNGSFRYTPAPGFVGTDRFQYRVSDGLVESTVVTVELTTTNTAPVSAADTYVTGVGQAVEAGVWWGWPISWSSATPGVLANDGDPDGHSLTASLVAGPTQGTLQFNDNGSFRYLPEPGFLGLDSFTYQVADGLTTGPVTTVRLVVAGVAPQGADDTYSVHSGQTLQVGSYWYWNSPLSGVLANDSDPDGSSLTATLANGPVSGMLQFNANGSFQYTPYSGFSGTDSFTYQVSDGLLVSAPVTVTLRVTDTAPVALDDAYLVHAGQQLTVGQLYYWGSSTGVLVNDADADGDNLQAALVGEPVHGTLTLNANGSFVYSPDSGYVGTDEFTYRVSDGVALSNVATVRIHVINTIPVAVADAYATQAGQTLAISPYWTPPGGPLRLLANDQDADGDSLTAVLETGPSHGTLALDASGAFSYTPDAGFVGVDTFAYRVSDGFASSAPVEVALLVYATLPTAVGDAYTTHRNQTLTGGSPYSWSGPTGVLANDKGVEPSTQTTLVNGPAHGTLTLYPNGAFVYTPDSEFLGQDTFSYALSTGAITGEPVTVTIEVTDTAPVALADAYLVPALSVGRIFSALESSQNTSSTGLASEVLAGFRSQLATAGVAWQTAWSQLLGSSPSLAQVAGLAFHSEAADQPTLLANDQDVDGDTLVPLIVEQPLHGQLTLSSDGSFSYLPDAGFVGIDSFTYRVRSGTDSTAPLSDPVTVTLRVVDVKPLVPDRAYILRVNQTLDTTWGQGNSLLETAVNVTENPLDAVLQTGPQHGSLTLNRNGTFIYTPDVGFVGQDSFTFRAFAGAIPTDPVTVTLTVTNHAPVAVGESYTVAKRTAAESPSLFVGAGQSVLANDSDADGDPILARLISGPANGTLLLNPDGTFYYTANVGWTGSDTFTYAANDGGQSSATTTVTLNVVADSVVAVADSYRVTENGTLSDNVTLNDRIGAVGALDVSLVSGPQHGQLTLDSWGTFTYTPTSEFVGVDTFLYQLTVGTEWAWTQVNITVEAESVPPPATAEIIAKEDRYTLSQGQMLARSNENGVLANDWVMKAGTYSVQLVSNVPTNHGTLYLQQGGGFTFLPKEGFLGVTSFTYSVNGSQATVSLVVTNDKPETQADHYVTHRDAALVVPAAFGTLANDTDANQDPLTAVLENQASHGWVELDASGSFVYTPNPGFIGTDSFTYQAGDGSYSSVITLVTIRVLEQAPQVADDAYTIVHDRVLTQSQAGGVAANDVDPDGDSISVLVARGPQHGTLDLRPSGAFTYTPNPGFVGVDSFTYRATDGSLFGKEGLVVLTVTNEAPIVQNEVYGTAQNVVLVIDPLAGILVNDFDPDGDPFTPALVDDVRHGTLTLHGGGSFVYTPDVDFVGTDSFSYRLSDGFQTSAVAVVTLTVTGNLPGSSIDEYSLEQDSSITVSRWQGVLVNDTDAEGDTLTAELVTSTAHGQLQLLPSGAFSYTPDAGFVGTDSFTYRANDGRHPGRVTLVTLRVQPAPTPVTADDFFSVGRNGVLNVSPFEGLLTNDTVESGRPAVAVLAQGPSHGTLTINAGGSFLYTPVVDFVGVDSFTYRVYDGLRYGREATVRITVTNSTPLAGHGAQSVTPTEGSTVTTAVETPLTGIANYTLTHDATLVVPLSEGVLSSLVDADGDLVVAQLVAGPAFGTLTLNPSGSFTYTPPAGFVGTDTFVFQVSDGVNRSGPQVVRLTVTNAAPVGGADVYITEHNTAMNQPQWLGPLANDRDADGDRLVATLATGPAHGTVTINSSGAFVYTPDVGFVGTDLFTYHVSDGLVSSPATPVLVQVRNTAPSVPDEVVLVYDPTRPLTIAAPEGLLARSADAEGDALSVTLVEGPRHGQLWLGANGAFTYLAETGSTGLDSFLYRVGDGSLSSRVVAVLLKPGTTPVARDDVYSLPHDQALTIRPGGAGLLGNDSLSAGQPLVVTLISGPSHGTLSLAGDGSFTYTPDAGFVGLDAFRYQASDGLHSSNTATVLLNVTNTAPVASSESYDLSAGQLLSVSSVAGVLINDRDADGDRLTPSVVVGPAHGTLDFLSNGAFTYQPFAGFVGTDSFVYQITDGISTASAVVTLRVSNTPPAPLNDSYSVRYNRPLVVGAGEGILANDQEDDGQPLNLALVAGVSHGTLSFNADGSFVYTPYTDFVGTDQFLYQVSDGIQFSRLVTVSLTVGNELPEGQADGYTIHAGSALIVGAEQGVLANDTDADGEALSAVLVEGVAHGSLTLYADGSFVYQAAAGFLGSDGFTYRPTDGRNFGAAVRVTLSVGNTAPTLPAPRFAVVHDRALLVEAAAGLLAGITDPDGDVLTVSLLTGPTHGILQLVSDGAFTYVPQTGFAGADSFTVLVSDGFSNTIITAVIDVLERAPQAGDDRYELLHGTSLFVSLFDNPLSASGSVASGSDPLISALSAQDNNGGINPDTSNPFANLLGSALLSGNNGLLATAAASGWDPTSAANTWSSNPRSRPVVLLVASSQGLLANDSDLDEDALQVRLVDGPTHGSLTLTSYGGFLYTPDADFVGTDSFVYQVGDGHVWSNPATARLVVHNPAPTARDDSYTVQRNGLLSVPLVSAGLLANDTNADGDPVTAVLGSDAAHGEVTLRPDGTFLYRPVDGFVGSDTFTYYLSDGRNQTQAVVRIEVQNQAPTVTDWTYGALKNSTTTIAANAGVREAIQDANFDSVQVILVRAPLHGELTLAADGSFTYTPHENYVGEDSFQFVASDGYQASPPSTVTIQVSNDNDAAQVEETNLARRRDYQLRVAAWNVAVDGTESLFTRVQDVFAARGALEDATRAANLAYAETARAAQLVMWQQALTREANAAATRAANEANSLALQRQAAVVYQNQVNQAHAQGRTEQVVAAATARAVSEQALMLYLSMVAQANADQTAAARTATDTWTGTTAATQAGVNADLAATQTAYQATRAGLQAGYLATLADAAQARELALIAAQNTALAAQDQAADWFATILASANSTYASAVGTAGSVRASAVSAAQSAFEQAVAAAQATYEAGTQDQGATTPLDLASDPDYQAALADIQADYDVALAAAQALYLASLATAKSVLNTQVAAATQAQDQAADTAAQNYQTARQAANLAYTQAAQAAQASYDSAVTSAWTAYRGASQSANANYALLAQQAHLDHEAAALAAKTTFLATQEQAFQTARAALNAAQSGYEQAMADVDAAYNAAVANARSVRDGALASAVGAFDTAVLAAGAANAQARVQANDEADLRQIVAWGTLDTTTWDALTRPSSGTSDPGGLISQLRKVRRDAELATEQIENTYNSNLRPLVQNQSNAEKQALAGYRDDQFTLGQILRAARDVYEDAVWTAGKATPEGQAALASLEQSELSHLQAVAQATANFQAQLANPAATGATILQAKADYESAIRSASEIYLAARKTHRDVLWNAGLNTSVGIQKTGDYREAQKEYTLAQKQAELSYRQVQLDLIQQYLAPQQELARVKMVALAELQSALASSNTTATANYAVFVAQATATYNTSQALSTSTQAIALSNAGIDQSKSVASAASQFRQASLAAEADLTQAQIQALAAWQVGEAQAQEEQALTRATGERIQVLTVAAAEKTLAFALALAATDWQEATSYASTALGADLKQAGRTLSTALGTAGLDYRTAMTQANAAWSVDQESAYGEYQEAWLDSWIDWQEAVISARSDAGLFVADALESFRWLEAGAFEFAENERADSAAYLTHLWHLSEATNWSARVEAEAQAWVQRTEDVADAVTQYRRSRAEAATAWNLLVLPAAEAGSIEQVNTVADWSEAQTAAWLAYQQTANLAGADYLTAENQALAARLAADLDRWSDAIDEQSVTDALFSETLMDGSRDWIETEATAAQALALTLADADHARLTLDAASERAFALAEKQARQTYNTAAEGANATRAAADETVELTRQQEGWEAYRTYSAAESNAEAVRTSAREAAQVAFKQATSAAELVYTDEVGEAQVTRREVEAQAQRDFVVASKQAMPQQTVARLVQEITTAQNSAPSTFANVQPPEHLPTEEQKRDRAYREGGWAAWLNQSMDSWTDGGWSSVVASPEFGQILDAVDGFQAGFWNAMSFGLTTRIRNGLWGELAERNHHGFWFNLGTGVGTVAVIGLGLANPCGSSWLVMSGWRAYNGMQVFGGVLNAHDNFSQGHYFWGALDVVGVMFSTSQLLKACFAAGTPIRTAEGSKPVEEIQAGDYVLSRDENDPNGPILLKLVEETFVRTGRIWVLKIGGREIRTTSEHPFYARGRGWIAVAELSTNDLLLDEDGRWLPVESVEDTGGYETVYNFRVADFHTYFIGGDDWAWSVWAHNACSDFVNYVTRRGLLTPGQAEYAFTVLRANGFRAFRAYLRAQGLSPSQIGRAVRYARSVSQRKIAQVINETNRRQGPFTSNTRLTHDEALEAGLQYLQPGYRQLGAPNSGVFESADGLRRFRMDNNSLLGLHPPGQPHVHLEAMPHLGASHPRSNNHILLFGGNNG